MSVRLLCPAADVVRGALRPPWYEVRFWVVQAMVVGFAVLHYAATIPPQTPGKSAP